MVIVDNQQRTQLAPATLASSRAVAAGFGRITRETVFVRHESQIPIVSGRFLSLNWSTQEGDIFVWLRLFEQGNASSRLYHSFIVILSSKKILDGVLISPRRML